MEITIDNLELETVVKEAVSEMINFDWSGWKIDILLSPEGEVFKSAKNTSNIYPHSHVLFSIHPIEFEEGDLNDFINENTSQYLQMFEAHEIGFLSELKDIYDVTFI